MGTIVQFAERLAEDGDWTPSERSQLRDMGSQLAEATAGLDLVFGQTEEGDPWCVVADPKNEVLLHVARIGGQFVVHSPRDDQMVEEHDLWSAVTRVLGGLLRERRGVVLPFPPEAMGQPAALALILAAAIRGDFRGLIQNGLPQAPGEHDQAEATPMPQMPVQHGAEAEAQRAIARLDAQQQGQHHNAGSTHQAQAGAEGVQHTAQGGGGPLNAQQAAQAIALAELSQAMPANANAQTMSVAPPATGGGNQGGQAGGNPGGSGVPNTNNGSGNGSGAGGATGSGNGSTGGGDLGPTSGSDGSNGIGAPGFSSHTVMVENNNSAVARGTTGTADVFVLNTPNKSLAGSAFASLGTVEGYKPQEGDQIVFANGERPKVVENSVLQSRDLEALSSAFGQPAQAGQRVGYDTDGDGRADAWLVLIETKTELVLHKAASISTVGVQVNLDMAHAAEPPSAPFIGVLITTITPIQ